MTKQELIDKIEALEEQLEYHRRNYITGLYQRHDFMKKLEEKEKKKCKFKLTMYDVNGLHETNRLHGYSAGDALLKKVAADLMDCKDGCYNYHIGGDEFFTISRTEPPEIEGTTQATVDSKDFNTIDEMLDAVDKLVREKKRKLKRRRTDI